MVSRHAPWLAPLGVVLALGCIEVDPLGPCRDSDDCPARQVCAQGECQPMAAEGGTEIDAKISDAAGGADSVAPPDAQPPDAQPPDAAPDDCDRVCQRIADCATSGRFCPNLSPASADIVVRGCLPVCRATPGLVPQVDGKRTCAGVIELMRLDASFAALCG